MGNAKICASDVLKGIAKDLDITATTLQSETLDIKKDFLDTGSATLNAILSGSTKGGIPLGKITGFYGPSGCGKSFVIGKSIASAQAKGYIPIVIDTEGTWDQRAEGWGVDVGECILIQHDIIEEIRNQISQIIDKYSAELKSGDVKFMVILDSIGGLICLKEAKDVETDNNASDMGTRAKVLRTLFRVLTTKCAKHRIPFVWSNHSYDDPSAFMPSAIQKMPGGKAPWYFSSVIVMMRRKEDKNDEANTLVRNTGAVCPIECVKQRFVVPFIKAEMAIDYGTGMKRYFGLFELAKEYGVIEGSRTYNLSDGTKLGYKKDFINNAKTWEETILPILDPVLQKELGFGSKISTELMESLELDEDE
jgi:RecA/RadA recombinase